MSLWIILIFILTCFCFFSLKVEEALHESVMYEEVSCTYVALSELHWEKEQTNSIFYPELRTACVMYDHNVSVFKNMAYEEARDVVAQMKEKPPLIYCSKEVTSKGFSWDLDFIGTCDGYLYKMRLIAMNHLGITLGCFPLGIVSDVWGRKVSLYISVGFYYMGACFQPLATNFDMMQTFAVLEGIGRAGLENALLLLLLEHSNQRNRAILVVYMMMFGPIAFQMGITMKLKVRGYWKELSYILLVPSLIFLFYLWYVPESPRWYLSFSKKSKAWQFLHSLGTPIEEYHFLPDVKINKYTLFVENMTYLFNSLKLIKILLMGSYLLSFLVFAELHKKQFLGLNYLKPFAHHCIVCTARVFSYMYVLQPLLMLRRQLALLWFLMLISIQLFINLFTTAEGFYIVNALVLLCLHAVQNILSLYFGEVFPTCLRGTAMGILESVAYGIYAFHFMYKLEGRFITRWVVNLLYFVVSCIAIVLVWFLPEVRLDELPDYKRYRRDFKEQ